MASKKKSQKDERVFPTGKDSLADLRALWTQYRTDAKAYRQARLALAKRLSELQAEMAHPGNGGFVNYIREKVGIPVSTTYRLLDHFNRISKIVGNTEALQQAACEREIDLTEKKWEPALKKFAPAIKKAEGVPACREVIEKIEAFKLPATTAKQVAKNEADFAKDRAVTAATDYLERFSGKKFLTKWREFCREVLDELSDNIQMGGVIDADDLLADATPPEKKPAATVGESAVDQQVSEMVAQIDAGLDSAEVAG